MRTVVLKLGGELLETSASRDRIGSWAASVPVTGPLVIVHGGGRAIDAELARRRIEPRKIDGLRVTDEETLDAVVAVLAGSANTDLVAALVRTGVRGVGLTGVDAGFGRAARTTAYRTAAGDLVDLGLVGDPETPDVALVRLLTANGYVPVVASLGVDQADAAVLNINADVMACRLAAALGDCTLAIAGATAGVLDDHGRTIPALDLGGIDRVIASGTATAGMVAKLVACRAALAAGVATIRLIDGRALDGLHGIDIAPGTTLSGSRRPAP